LWEPTIPGSRGLTEVAAADGGTGSNVDTSVVPRFHLMAKPTGAVCNLGCTYCFFLDKELLYPGSGFG
jgi:hypothetical protein